MACICLLYHRREKASLRAVLCTLAEGGELGVAGHEKDGVIKKIGLPVPVTGL